MDVASVAALSVTNRAEVVGTVTITLPREGIGISSTVTANNTKSNNAIAVYGKCSTPSKQSTVFYASNTGEGVDQNICMYLDSLPEKTGNYSLYSMADAASYIKGKLGIGWLTPTVPLEVGGATKLRGTLDVVGNITSTGTAHNFAAKSIPASAISGGLSIPNKTPASQTAAGAAGEFAWDANYLYGCIAANDWRRLPWTDWHGNTLPGAGAGATDTSLPWTATPAGGTGSTPNVGPYITSGQTTAITPLGKIVMSLGTAIPALATGVKVQYRIHGGNWVDATVTSYWSGPAVSTYAAKTSFVQMAADATGKKAVVIDGPPPNVPYITRMAWVSSLGVGQWSTEFTAVTPTA
jgi:hypothetical protein